MSWPQASRGCVGSRPKGSIAELPDDDLAARLEHARHLGDGALRVADEAERGHRNDPIELSVCKGWRFGASLNEPQLDGLLLRAAACCSQHSRIRIEAPDPGPLTRKCRCQRAVAAADVENAQAITGPSRSRMRRSSSASVIRPSRLPRQCR